MVLFSVGVKVSVWSALSVTAPPVTATVPLTAIGVPLMVAMATGVPSSTSVSLVRTAKCESGVSSGVVSVVSELATGASLTGVTWMVTVCDAESTVPSFALNWNVASPLKFAVGVNVKVPSGFTVAAPLVAEPPTSENVRPSPSTSVPATAPASGVSSLIV